jgi:hypothetical protein
LRTLRSIYNKGILVHRLVDEKPLLGFLDGKQGPLIAKKYLDRDDCGPENATEFIGTAKQKYLIFLLQFYLVAVI